MLVVDEQTTGERLRAWREEQGLSQAKAAETMGTKQRTWADWEYGRLVPDVDFADRIEQITKGRIRSSDWAESLRAKRSKDESGTDVAVTAEKAG